MSTYEAWRATHQDAEAAAKAAFEQVQGLAKMVDSLQGALGAQVRFGSVSDAAASELRRLHAENQDLRTRHYCNTAEIESLRARVQELGEMARENRSKRVIELEQRIAEMEEQMAAIGAGGVESLRKREEPAALTAQEENQGDHLFDAVLHCPHSITHESLTLHFYPRQKEGHNALAQLRHRLAAADFAARRREMQLLGEIEALERLALALLKQRGAGAALAAPDERQAFEKWLRIKPCGAAHDFGWEAWKARAALNAAPEDATSTQP